MVTSDTPMRVSLANLAVLPPRVAAFVREAAKAKRTQFFRLEVVDRFSIAEDATYTAFSADGAAHRTAAAAGEWRGVDELRPGAFCPLPPGCWVVEGAWFLGRGYLRVLRGSRAAITVA